MRRHDALSLWVMLAGLACGSGPGRDAVAQGAGTVGPKPTVFRNVRIFDGMKVIPRGSVVVQGGKIAAVGPVVKPPKGATVIDGSGKTLIPGLIDAHTHVFFPTALKQALVFGVTTELDMFTSIQFASSMKRQLAGAAGREMADLRSAGTLVTAPGGHGTEYGLPIPTITAPDQAQAFVDARIAEGSDYIKIVYDDGKSFGLRFATIDKATMQAVIAAAHARKRMAVVHISTLQAARDAIECGADGLVHLFVDRDADPGFGKFVKERGGFVVPTLTVLQSASAIRGGETLVTDVRLEPYLSMLDMNSLKTSFPPRPGSEGKYAGAEAAVRQLKAAGVPILAGTDAPNPGTVHGASIHRELELLVNAGLTPIEALASATSVTARAFGLTDRGQIAVAKRADLVLVNGDPTKDILATRDIVGVWKVGNPVDRKSYRAEIQKARREPPRL